MLGWGRSKAHYPTLASWVKAAHCKIMLMWVADLCYRDDDGTQDSRLKCVASWAIEEFLHVLDVGGTYLSAELRDRAVYAAAAFLKCYQQLACNMLARGMRLYKLRPKLHYFCHQVDVIRRSGLNVRKVQCYIDEGFIGRICSVASSTDARTVMLRTIQ
eukprot:3916320-Alexandrium_andersonii.AAC.1